MPERRPTVNLTETEAATIEKAAKDRKLDHLSFSNLARKALAAMLGINLPTLEHGGARPGTGPKPKKGKKKGKNERRTGGLLR